MNGLKTKFEEAKRQYEKKENTKKEILKKLVVTDEVKLRTYTSKPEHSYILCQKEISFENLKDEYYILHEEDDPKYHDMRCYYICAGPIVEEIVVTSMYILIPKKEDEETLCLFIKRTAGKRIRFYNNFPEKTSEKFQVMTKLFLETHVSAYLEEYDFDKEKECSKQKNDNCFTFSLKRNDSNYQKILKEYIKNTCLNETLVFKIPDSEDFKRYIRVLRKCDQATPLDLDLQEVYKKFEEAQKYLEFSDMSVKENIYGVWAEEEKKLVEIRDDKDVFLGFVWLKVQVVNIAISDKKRNGVKQVVKLVEERTFNEVLKNLVGTSFKL